jgi:hypothetical protein
MEQPQPQSEDPRGRPPRSPVYYVQVHRDAAPPGDWIAVDVAEDKREAARIAAGAVRGFQDARGEPARVRVIGSTELLRQGGQEAINRAARDLWAVGNRPDRR